MAVPAYSKLPTEEPGSPAGNPAPESPVYTESPIATRTSAPPSYPTVHRLPPAASIATTDNTNDDDDDVRTININITINIPKSFHFPCFRRRCRRDGTYVTRDGYQIPREEKKRRFVAVMMVLFYTSFWICGAIAWGLKNTGIWEYSAVPLVIVTFSPFIDFFVVAATILLVRRMTEDRKPGFRFAVLILLNICLFILHIVIMIIAAGPWTHVYGYGWYYGNKMKAVVGLTLYVVSAMTAIKLLLAIWIIKKRSKANTSLRENLRENLRAFREEIRQAVGVEDAARAEEGEARRSQEGRVFLS